MKKYCKGLRLRDKQVGLIILIVLLSGCAQKVKIRALEPAQIDRAADTKKIALTKFRHDTVGLAAKIEAKLYNTKIDGKHYFTLISRNDLEHILKEQKLQNSGLIHPKEAVDIGELIGVEAIISGDIGRVTAQDSRFYERRSRCRDHECKRIEYYDVVCTTRVVGFSTELRMVDVKRGDIIYAQTLTPTESYKHCWDDGVPLPSPQMAADEMADEIAKSFVYKLTPHYRTFSVKLLDEGDLDYTDEQEKLLEMALKYIEQSRYDKAEQMLIELIESTNKQSYVAFYNLGVIKEAQGRYTQAKEYYEKADSLMVEPVEAIDNAVVRIKKLIQNRKRTHEQLKR